MAHWWFSASPEKRAQVLAKQAAGYRRWQASMTKRDREEHGRAISQALTGRKR